jgi:hypothetical protein
MFKVVAQDGDKSRDVETRAEAEDVKEDMEQLGLTVSIEAAEEPETDGGEVEAEVVDMTEDTQPEPEPESEQFGDMLSQLGESINTDPLSILPGYMITQVDGKPSLNKRGVSVLAYHFGISVTEKETVAYPHETDYTSAIVEITVENEDGRVFVGAGEAHVDETPKHQLLRMAETRAYKRAVIFATGTGIVGYQEIMEELN